MSNTVFHLTWTTTVLETHTQNVNYDDLPASIRKMLDTGATMEDLRRTGFPYDALDDMTEVLEDIEMDADESQIEDREWKSTTWSGEDPFTPGRVADELLKDRVTRGMDVELVRGLLVDAFQRGMTHQEDNS